MAPKICACGRLRRPAYSVRKPRPSAAAGDAVQHPEEREEDRRLQQDRQAARERVGPVLLVELHHLLLLLLASRGRFPCTWLWIFFISGCSICSPRWALICFTNSGISRIRITTTRPTIDSAPGRAAVAGSAERLEQGVERHDDERDGVVQRLRGSCRRARASADPGARSLRRCAAARRSSGGNGVEAAGVPRVAAQQPAQRRASRPRTAPCASIASWRTPSRTGRTGRRGPSSGRDDQLVDADRQHEHRATIRRCDRGAAVTPCGAADRGASAVQRAVQRRAEVGRTTRRRPRAGPDHEPAPAGSRSSRSAHQVAQPARPGCAPRQARPPGARRSRPGPGRRRASLRRRDRATCRTTDAAPAGPAPARTGAVKSARRRSRCRPAARRLAWLRPTDVRGPCGGGRRGSRGRHGCACAAGSHGSSRGGGCSAGTCACSLGGSRLSRCCGIVGIAARAVGSAPAPARTRTDPRTAAPAGQRPSTTRPRHGTCASAATGQTGSRPCRNRYARTVSTRSSRDSLAPVHGCGQRLMRAPGAVSVARPDFPTQSSRPATIVGTAASPPSDECGRAPAVRRRSIVPV